MKKWIWTALLIACFVIPACGADLPDFGLSKAQQSLPSGAEEALGGAQSASGLLDRFGFSEVLDFLTNNTFTIARGAFRDFGKLVAVVLTFVMVDGLMRAADKRFTSAAFDFASMLCAALAVYSCMKPVISAAQEAICDLSVYLKALMPVFAGVLAAGGAPVSAAVLPSAALTAISLLSDLNTRFFLPLVQVYLAVCLASGISQKVLMLGLADLVKSAVNWCLTATATVFVSVLSVQRIITGASDGAVSRTAKLAVSTFVPVVGGIVKDALETVAGGVAVIRSVTGALGIAAVFYVLIPVFIRLFLYAGMFRIAAAFAGLSGGSRLHGFLKAASEAWNVVFAVTACEGLLLVLGVAILLTVGGG